MTRDQRDVATSENWPDLRPMPEKCVRLPVHIHLNSAQATRLRQGFIPVMQEEKWFAYVEDDILYQHRSWTGFCIDIVPFKDDGEGGLVASQATVNRNPEQYSETDDAADIERIETMVVDLADLPPGAKSKAVDPFVQAFELALKPNYLGSPDVIRGVVRDYVETLIPLAHGEDDPDFKASTPPEHERAGERFIRILTGEDPAYVTMPWFSAEQLGNHLRKTFDIGSDGEGTLDLRHDLIAFRWRLDDEIIDRLLEVDADAPRATKLAAIKPITDFVETVLLGTNDALHPDLTWEGLLMADRFPG